MQRYCVNIRIFFFFHPLILLFFFFFLSILIKGDLEIQVDSLHDPKYTGLALDDHDEADGRKSPPTLVPAFGPSQGHGPAKVSAKFGKESLSPRKAKGKNCQLCVRSDFCKSVRVLRGSFWSRRPVPWVSPQCIGRTMSSKVLISPSCITRGYQKQLPVVFLSPLHPHDVSAALPAHPHFVQYLFHCQ